MLLSDEEIQKAKDSIKDYSGKYAQSKAIAKAQANAIAEWGEGKCPHYKRLLRRRCDQCWQQFRKEVE